MLGNLDDALVLNTRIDTAPEYQWIGADKKSLRKDQLNVFTEIETLLSNPGITTGNIHINELKDLIDQEFNEDIEQARKYYGMHVVLIKFVINMQQTYINKLNDEYLPKIKKILFNTVILGKESKKLLRTERKAASINLLKKT